MHSRRGWELSFTQQPRTLCRGTSHSLHHSDGSLRGNNLARASRVVHWASLLILAGCAHWPPPPPDSSWCASVSERFKKEGVRCLELAGSRALTFFGPEAAPKRYSLAPCADGGAEPARSVEIVGDYVMSYSYKTELDGSAGLNLKALTGLRWAPDLAASSTGKVTASARVTLKNARWVAISDVRSWLQGRIDSTRFDVSKQAVYESCRATERSLCEPTNEFTEEVLEAIPVITVTADRDLKFSLSVGLDSAGARFNIVDQGGGTTQVAWGDPLTIGARISQSRGIVAPCL